MEETWRARDLPVLVAAAELLERSYLVTVSDIGERTGLDQGDVARSLEALNPTHVDFRRTETGGDPTFWYVLKITPEGRRALGQWPSPEGLVNQLVKGLRDAAMRDRDSVRQSQLIEVAGMLAGPIRDVAVQVAADVVGVLPRPAGGSSTGDADRLPVLVQPVPA